MTPTLWFLYALTALAGLVPGGLAFSLWHLTTGRDLRPEDLARYDLLTPFRAVALYLYAPLGLLRAGLSALDSNPLLAVMICSLGLGWSFLAGVFILTTFFGFT